MTIGKKLALTCGGLIGAAAVLSVVAIGGLQRLDEKTQLIVADPLPGIATITQARSAFLRLRGDVWQHLAMPNAEAKEKCERSIGTEAEDLEKALKLYEPTITTEGDRALFTKIRGSWEAYHQRVPAVLELSRAGKSAEAAAMYIGELGVIRDTLLAALKDEVELNKARGDQLAVESQATYRSGLWLLVSLLVVCGAAGSGLAFYIVRGISGILRQTVNELKAGSDQVAGASSHITASSHSLAQGASEQAASLEQTSASTEEINSMARKNSENSREAAGLVTESERKFSEAKTRLDEMVVAMDGIGKSSDKISKIIKVIDEIAFQTNILALNAAVEAARAGEAGMGFAVVADEVRNLAQRCAQAAKDTSGLIAESIGKAHDGKVKVNDVSEAVRAVTEDMGRVKVLVDEVSTSSEEQARGIDQIAQGVAQMGKVTQSAAATAEESASAAAELSAQAETVKTVIDKLVSLVDSDARVTDSRRGVDAPVAKVAARKTSVAEEPAANEFPLEMDF